MNTWRGFQGRYNKSSRVFSPIAWALGVSGTIAQPSQAARHAHVLNEFVGFVDLGQSESAAPARSFVIATFALCGSLT